MARHAYQDRGTVYKDALLHDRHLRASLAVTHRTGCFSTCIADPLQYQERSHRAHAERNAGDAVVSEEAVLKAPTKTDAGTPVHGGTVIDELAAKYGCVMDTVLDSDSDEHHDRCVGDAGIIRTQQTQQHDPTPTAVMTTRKHTTTPSKQQCCCAAHTYKRRAQRFEKPVKLLHGWQQCELL